MRYQASSGQWERGVEGTVREVVINLFPGEITEVNPVPVSVKETWGRSDVPETGGKRKGRQRCWIYTGPNINKGLDPTRASNNSTYDQSVILEENQSTLMKY